jgi:C4-dicarboxylate-specific signal transduction histidine kinase
LQNVLEASRLAADILRSMRTLAGQAHAARARCSLADAVEDVLAQYQGQLARLAVVPQVAFGHGAGCVWASPVQLHQLLRNLVGNALDALAPVRPEVRSLRIDARVDGSGMLVLTVQDSGAGMDAGQARQAFEPMVGSKPHGMGLGLAICRAIVDAHDGQHRRCIGSGKRLHGRGQAAAGRQRDGGPQWMSRASSPCWWPTTTR